MKRTIKLLTAIAVTAGLVGCASKFAATFDHDDTADFSNYKTFAWISEHPMKVGDVSQPPNPLLEGEIMVTIESGLGEKGYKLIADPDTADFVLSLTLGSRTEIRANSYPTMSVGVGYGGWGAPYYGGGYGGYVGASTASVRQYNKGMLAMDVFDGGKRTPVWHGVTTKTISESDYKDVDGTIQAAVDSILEGFPPDPVE